MSKKNLFTLKLALFSILILPDLHTLKFVIIVVLKK